MPLKLHVTLTGMCLFVPDPGGTKMHVLMPETGNDPDGGPHVHDHDPFLVYDQRHESKDAAESPRVLPLEGWAVDLSGSAGTGTKLTLGTGIVNLRDLTERKLDRPQLDRNARKSVASILTLPKATYITPGPLVQWEIEKLGKIWMTHQVTWTVEGIGGSSIPLVRAEMRGKKTETIAELRPFGGTDTVRLHVVHLPDGPDPKPTASFKATHFAAYYRPYKGGHKGGPVPTLKSAMGPKVLPPFGGTAFTCMVAQVTPE